MDDTGLSAEGVVTRLDPGAGVAVQFREMNREARARDVQGSGVCAEDDDLLQQSLFE